MDPSDIPNTRTQGDEFLTDFDILAPPKRVAKIGGEEIDVSFIPTRVALKFIDFSKKHKAKDLLKPGTDESKISEKDLDDNVLEDVIEIVAEVCKRSSPKITKDFLLDNVDMGILLKFVKFVFNPLLERVKDMTKDGSEQGAGSEPGEEVKN